MVLIIEEEDFSWIFDLDESMASTRKYISKDKRKGLFPQRFPHNSNTSAALKSTVKVEVPLKGKALQSIK